MISYLTYNFTDLRYLKFSLSALTFQEEVEEKDGLSARLTQEKQAKESAETELIAQVKYTVIESGFLY